MRKLFIAFLTVFVLACGGTAPAASVPPVAATGAFPATVTDFQGQAVAIAKRPERIVSIGPSNTEFLFALGAGPRVVGVDDFSDEPAAAKAIEKVGGVKVNLEKVVSLRPDLVVMVKISDGTIDKLRAASLAVLVVDPQGLGDVVKSSQLLGTAVGADGGKLAKDITAKIDAVRAKTQGVGRVRVYHEVDASDPTKIFTVGPGSFIADLIDIAGGVNIAARSPSAYPQLSTEEIVRSDPEVIVVGMYEGDAEAAARVLTRAGWSAVSAVKSKRVVAIPGSLVSRPGPRVGDAAEAYAKAVHPELYR